MATQTQTWHGLRSSLDGSPVLVKAGDRIFLEIKHGLISFNNRDLRGVKTYYSNGDDKMLFPQLMARDNQHNLEFAERMFGAICELIGEIVGLKVRKIDGDHPTGYVVFEFYS